ncbi:amidohydrolase family protein [Cupriavidus basilensis]
MSAREALEIATLGGARVLNRDDIGALAPGMSADFVARSTCLGVGFAGGGHDPVASLVFCTPANVATSVINGRVVVRDGQLLTADLPVVPSRHRRPARTLFERARATAALE